MNLGLASRPNPRLQRTRMRSPLSRQPLGGHDHQRFLVSLFFCLCFLGAANCSMAPAPADEAKSSALACRGHRSTILPALERRSLHGMATLSSDGSPLAGLRIILTAQDQTNPIREVVADAAGRFSFRPLPPGRYTLKTCLEGFDTVEIAVTLTASASDEPLKLAIALST